MLANGHSFGRIGSALVVTGLAIGLLAVFAIVAKDGAASSKITSTSELLTLVDYHDDSIAATVNGEPIGSKAVSIHMVTADLLGQKGDSREDILGLLVDDVLIAQEARRSGVSVEEWEITAAINAGVVQPLSDDLTSDEVKRFIQVILDLHGINIEGALSDLDLRRAYQGLILRGRYLEGSGTTREEVLRRLRAEATIVIPEPHDQDK